MVVATAQPMIKPIKPRGYVDSVVDNVMNVVEKPSAEGEAHGGQRLLVVSGGAVRTICSIMNRSYGKSQ